MTTAVRPLPDHGTLSRYKYHGCRCTTCRDNCRAHERTCYRKKAYGTWQPFVDADIVRAHLLHVMAVGGVGWYPLADEAGVPRSTVGKLLHNRQECRPVRITSENARRLLALEAVRRPGNNSPAIGTQRRIQVLMGEGWPQVNLGPQFGIHSNHVNALLRAERVANTTAESVADAYQLLNGIDPLTCGVTPRGMRIAKGVATQKAWPDRLFWEDTERIDDPDFDPATILGDTPMYMRVGEDALWLRRQGYSLQQIADRFGRTTGYVAKNITRYLEATAGDGQAAA